MFKWLKGGSKSSQKPSEYELTSRIASVIDAFIDQVGVDEFALPRLNLIVGGDYRVSISQRDLYGGAIAMIPLKDLELDVSSVLMGGPMRHMAVDLAARSALPRLR